MKERLRGYIDKLFEDAPKSEEATEVREELFANLLEHYYDLVETGKSEEEAYQTVVSNIGDISEVISSLKAANQYEQKQKEDNGPFYDRTWTIGSIIDNVINNISSAFDTDYPVVNDKSYDCIGIQSVNIDFISESIKFYLNNTDEIRIVEYMSKTPSKEELAQVDIFNGEFNIKNGKRLFFISKSRVEIYLPRSFHGDLNIKVTSSSIKSSEKFELRNLRIKGISCSTNFESLETLNTEIHVTSGSIKIGKLTGRHNLRTESGSIKINQASGSGEYKTTSGSINVNYLEFQGDAVFSVVSGSTRVTIPRNTSFNYELTVVSGNIHTCIDASQYSSSKHSVVGVVGEDSLNKVLIKSISGGIWLQNN